MVRIEKNKLIIEMETSAPEEIYADLLKDVIKCIQAAGRDKDNDEIHDSLHFLLELYKAMLPSEEQVSKMFAK